MKETIEELNAIQLAIDNAFKETKGKYFLSGFCAGVSAMVAIVTIWHYLIA